MFVASNRRILRHQCITAEFHVLRPEPNSMPNKYIDKLKGKIVVIIGGTSGIGFAVAEACIEHGATVVVSSRKQDSVNKTVASLKASYPEAATRIRGHTCNLGLDDCEPEIVKLFDFATSTGASKVDHVVNTAGEMGDFDDSLENASADSIVQAQRTYLVSTLLLAKVVHKYINPASTSSLTMTTGALVHRPMKGMSVRLGIVGSREVLARTLAVDMAPVRVNVVSPGAIDTPMLRTAAEAMGGREVGSAIFRKATLVNEIGTPEDCAEAYLCSIKNNFMTGTVLHAEGGLLLQSS